jgi:hypothetical protein
VSDKSDIDVGGDISAALHRCQKCGAVLEPGDGKEEVIRCLFCGSDHRFDRKAKDASDAGEAQLHRESNTSTAIVSFLGAAVIGAFAVRAANEYLISHHAPWSLPIVGVVFLIIGLAGARVPASLGLLSAGLVGLSKPLLLRQRGLDGYFLALDSEANMLWIVPAVMALVAGYGFLANVKIRELPAAVRAAMPSVLVLVLAAAGAAVGYFA